MYIYFLKMNMSNVVVVKSNLPRFSNLAAALWCGVVGGSESNGGATLLLNHEIANNLSSQEQLSISGRSIHC